MTSDAIGIAYVALRRHSLYAAQLPSRVGPLPGPEPEDDVEALRRTPVPGTAAVAPEVPALADHATLSVLVEAARGARRQRVIAVTGHSGPRGLVEIEIARQVPASELEWLKVGDAMVPFVSVAPGATLEAIAETLERCGISQVPVVEDGRIVGWIGDRELRLALLGQDRSG